jgi:hypothetical protein
MPAHTVGEWEPVGLSSPSRTGLENSTEVDFPLAPRPGFAESPLSRIVMSVSLLPFLGFPFFGMAPTEHALAEHAPLRTLRNGQVTVN